MNFHRLLSSHNTNLHNNRITIHMFQSYIDISRRVVFYSGRPGKIIFGHIEVVKLSLIHTLFGFQIIQTLSRLQLLERHSLYTARHCAIFRRTPLFGNLTIPLLIVLRVIFLFIVERHPKLEPVNILVNSTFPLDLGTLKNTFNFIAQRTMFPEHRLSSFLFSVVLNVVQSDGVVIVFVPPEGLLRCEHIFEG